MRKTFLEYTNTWVNAINRGGLFRVHDGVYIFFRQVKMVVRTFFNAETIRNYQGESIASLIFTKLIGNPLVKKGWCDISSHVESDSTSFYLLKHVLKKYVAVREIAPPPPRVSIPLFLLPRK